MSARPMSQECSSCGLVESAGVYCSRCLALTQPAWLHADPRYARVRHFATDKPLEPRQMAQGRSLEDIR